MGSPPSKFEPPVHFSPVGESKGGGFQSKAFSRENIFLAVILAIPLMLTLVGIGQILGERDVRRLEHFEGRMEELLSKVERLANTQEAFTRILQNLEKRVFSSADPQKTFERLTPLLKKRFPETLCFTFLDGQGSPVPRLCDSRVPKVIMKRFFAAFQNFQKGETLALEKEKSVIQGFLGSMAPLAGEVAGKTYQVNSVQKHFAYLSRVFPQGMFIVQLDRRSNWSILAIEERLRALNVKSARLRMHLFEDFSRPADVASFFAVDQKKVARLIHRFERNFETQFLDNQEMWGWLPIYPEVKLVWRWQFGDASPAAQQMRWFGAVFLAFLFLAVFLFHWIKTRNTFVSIRFKLILAFLYCAGMPLLIITLTAITYMGELREGLEKNLHKKIEKALGNFDNGFPNYVLGMEFSLREKIKRRFSSEGIFERDIPRMIGDLQKQYHFDLAKVLDQNGALVFEKAGHSLFNVSKRNEKFYSRIASLILRNVEATLATTT